MTGPDLRMPGFGRLNRARTRLGPKQFATVAVVLLVVSLVCFIDWFAIEKRISHTVYLQIELVLLIGIELAYVIALFVSGVAVPVLVHLYLVGRRRGQTRPWISRWLLCRTARF